MQYYRIEGRKPVKFVVEMGLGACAEEWNSLVQSLKEKGGVLLYERAGTGRSESRYVQADHSVHYIHLTEPELILREVDRMLRMIE